MLPLIPNKDIAARDLWPLKEGRNILEAITDKKLHIKETEDQSYLLSVEQQWQLFSSKIDIHDSYNSARQKLLEMVEIHRNLSTDISQQRCLAITEDDDRYRLWQIVKIEETLGQLLEKAYKEKNVKKISAMLFVVADKFFMGCQHFSKLEPQLLLDLNNLVLKDNAIIFTGFIPTTSNTLTINTDHCFKQAFQRYITQLTEDSEIKNSLISYYLSVHAQENATNKMLVNRLLMLFKQ